MKTLLLAAILAVPVVAIADQDADSGSAQTAQNLNPVLVTATRTPVSEANTLANVTVITREQIAQSQATDLSDLLRYQAGLDIGRNGGPGQTTSVFMDGGNSDHTLILIDGVPLNSSAFGPAAGLPNITPDMIQRIEIVKGPGSTLYGSDAIAGVINIITRSGTQSGVDLHALAGSYDTQEASGQFSYNGDGKQVSLLAQNLTSDGIPPCAGSGEDIPGGYRQSTINLSGSTQAGPVQLGARFWNTQGRTQYDISCGAGDAPTSQNYRDQIGAVTASGQPMANWQSTLNLSRAQDDIQQNTVDPYAAGQYDFTTSIRQRLDWHNVLALGSINRVSFGGQATHEDIQALSYGAPADTGYDSYSGFVQDEINSGRQHGVIAGSYVNYTTFGSHASWNAEYGYDVLKDTRLIASAGTGFHAPEYYDLYGPYGNPDLKPEQSHSYELGLRQQIGTHQVIDARVFRRDTTDLITSNPPAYIPFNIDHARNQGAELSYRLEIEQWSARLTAITQNPVDETTGAQLLRRAKQSISGQLTRHFGASYIALNALATGRRPDIDNSTYANIYDGGYTLLALSGGLQLSKAFSLQARLDNLLNKQYQTANGYNQPGAGVFVSLRYTE